MKLVYSEKEVMDMLGVKETTMRKYREEGYIRYSRVNDRIWYLEEYIREFIDRNQKPPFKYDNMVA